MQEGQRFLYNWNPRRTTVERHTSQQASSVPLKSLCGAPLFALSWCTDTLRVRQVPVLAVLSRRKASQPPFTFAPFVFSVCFLLRG